MSSSNSSTKSGNTKQIPPAKHWCFTWNNYPSDYFSILDSSFRSNSSKYLFQQETGECGTPHIQGVVSFLKKLRPLSLLLSRNIHWEKCRNISKSYSYCQKQDTRTGEVHAFNVPLIRHPRIITSLYLWQISALNMISNQLAEQDDRTINWVWDGEGNTGKSAFTRYLVKTRGAIVCAGKASDMKYQIAQYYDKHQTGPDIVIFDVPRSMENYISWSGIEEIKNGCFCSSKYESSMVLVASPVVLIFANFEPDTDYLSKDRWNIIELQKGDLTPTSSASP